MGTVDGSAMQSEIPNHLQFSDKASKLCSDFAIAFLKLDQQHATQKRNTSVNAVEHVGLPELYLFLMLGLPASDRALGSETEGRIMTEEMD